MACGRWKQWWKMSNTCCSKKILLLLGWIVLLKFSQNVYGVLGVVSQSGSIYYRSIFLSLIGIAPIVGWLADVKFGRYEVIKFASLISFLISMLLYSEFLVGERSTLTTILLSVSFAMQCISSASFAASVLPFLTDQLIGATSDELSAVVQWYVWAEFLGMGLAYTVCFFGIPPRPPDSQLIPMAIIYAIPLAVIIISDCLCQQWLDRTHKVTNPIKLIIHVLNYTRKHRYPERRSAFTYNDEEQPSRMDYGKEKFGGPFTEEEVEDVKTVLRLIPLVVCSSAFSGTEISPECLLVSKSNITAFINNGVEIWLFPVLLISVYRFVLYRFVHRYTTSILNTLAIGMALYLVGYIAFEAVVVKGIVDADDVQSYLSCTTNTTLDYYHDYIEWYWKLGPYLFCGVGGTITLVLLKELIIAQSPDKMKGFVLGIMIASISANALVSGEIMALTLCSQISLTIILIAAFVVFLVLSKCYTLRERNREINIQAIVEEHYERYMDQEEEYMRDQHYFRENS